MTAKVSVTVIDGPEKGQTMTLESGSLMIGRGKGGLSLTDKKVSGRHCEILVDAGGVWVVDHGSTNGTFVGTQKISEKTALKNLDQVTVGLTKISVAIVEDLAAFKASNSSIKPSTKSPSGVFEIDDFSAEEEESVIDGIFDESSMAREATQTKTTPSSASKASKVSESLDENSSPTRANTPGKVAEIELPSKDAVYRETGIQRIEDMISDELSAFSKWDHPSADAVSQKPSSIPKVKVTLISRSPESVSGDVICSQAVTTFGRKEVDVRLNDLDVSRKHASVEIVGGNKAFVRDLASTNGTYVNGKKITYQEVKSGDLVIIGKTTFEVHIEGE